MKMEVSRLQVFFLGICCYVVTSEILDLCKPTFGSLLIGSFIIDLFKLKLINFKTQDNASTGFLKNKIIIYCFLHEIQNLGKISVLGHT